jgi:Icc-related predicted phosphoesterase
MITRIIHISDLHFPSRDASTADVLQDAIVQRCPNVLVVTGDLANHPSMWFALGKGQWIATWNWLHQIEERLKNNVTILLLPGNHDVLVSGLTGWCWPAAKAFKSTFGTWHASPVYYDIRANVTFLMLDTNPRGAWLTAEGRAIGGRLRRLKRELEHHADAARIRSSTKVLLMHHHPLPVPFQGSDWLLHTRRVDRLLRFIAETKIDLVLHGHKHRATWSHMRIGGTSVEPFFIEAVGAGSAMKRDDYDPRGHNFNLIDVAPGGTRQIRQFFKPPAADRFSEAHASEAEEQVSRLIRSQFRQPYRAGRLTWKLQADQEGDAKNELTFAGLVFNRCLDAYEIPLPGDYLEGGQALPYRALRVSAPALRGRLQQRDVDGQMRTFVVFDQRPLAEHRAEMTVENYTLNSYAMNCREAAELGHGDTERDSVDLLLTDAVDELCFEATFPGDFRFDTVRVEVLEPLDGADVVHEELTREFAGMPAARDNRVELRLPHPPPNYRYRVSWALPADHGTPQSGAAEARRARFEKVFLTFASAPVPAENGIDKAAQDAIIEGFQDLSSALERLIAASSSFAPEIGVIDDESTDLSVMVCDRFDRLPKLRLVFWNRQLDYPEVFRNFRLLMGNGNAGRAYKTRTLRLFDKEQAVGNPKASTYVQVDGIQHVFMFSIPLLDPRSLSPLAVVNVGTSDATQAAMFRALTADDLETLVREMHQEPLARLMQVAGLR